MQSYLYTIVDNVAQDLFGGIIRVTNDEVARRSFHDALKAPNGPFQGHEADYDLYLVGIIHHDMNGHIEGGAGPILIARGRDWLNANSTQTPNLELTK